MPCLSLLNTETVGTGQMARFSSGAPEARGHDMVFELTTRSDADPALRERPRFASTDVSVLFSSPWTLRANVSSGLFSMDDSLTPQDANR